MKKFIELIEHRKFMKFNQSTLIKEEKFRIMKEIEIPGTPQINPKSEKIDAK